jgi:hypothetical protein
MQNTKIVDPELTVVDGFCGQERSDEDGYIMPISYGCLLEEGGSCERIRGFRYSCVKNHNHRKTNLHHLCHHMTATELATIST